MNDFQRGQEEMRKRAAKVAHGMDDEVICSACSGSGYYDHNGSPPCGCCSGEGYTKATHDDIGYAISNLEIKKEE